MSNHRILIVEDEAKIATLLEDYLSPAGFSVSRLDRGDRVVSEVRRNAPDLILLDVMLPGKDGMEVCREIRKFSTVPIIMITARVEEVDRLVGLELGADDYICKPFSPREVVARVRAVLRRVYREPKVNKLLVEPLELDMSRYQVFVEEEMQWI
jgi:two-component system response regulator BaeR